MKYNHFDTHSFFTFRLTGLLGILLRKWTNGALGNINGKLPFAHMSCSNNFCEMHKSIISFFSCCQ